MLGEGREEGTGGSAACMVNVEEAAGNLNAISLHVFETSIIVIPFGYVYKNQR